MAVSNRARGRIASAEVRHPHGVIARMGRLRCRAYRPPFRPSSLDFLTTIEGEWLQIRRLHAWKGVAPLKRVHEGDQARRAVQSPRLEGRGPIEAG